MIHHTSSRLILLVTTIALLAAGCEKLAHIPHGPLVRLPAGWDSKQEGDILRIGSENLSTERCTVELKAEPLQISVQGDEWRMEALPGNTRHVVLARNFQRQTILLTFCPDDPTQNESQLRNILLHNLKP
ncbi:hypothetical protein EXS71_03570 [Candidatus Uhrbacteria bacterium]|nr:hypothetical protein [Candidatus Uhrbacteria bacterium]